MKTYEKYDLKFVYLIDTTNTTAELFVTGESLYKKLGYHKGNRSKWLKDNITDKYDDIFENYFYDFENGLCVSVYTAEEVLSNSPVNKDRCKALAEFIATESHDFHQKKKWKEDPDDTFYNENLKPKVTSALESITKTAETPFFDSEELRVKWSNTKIVDDEKDAIQTLLSDCVKTDIDQLPDRLLINGKEYISEEKYQKDTVTLQIKMDAMKSILEK